MLTYSMIKLSHIIKVLLVFVMASPMNSFAKDYKLSEAEEQLFMFGGQNSLTELFAHQCLNYARGAEVLLENAKFEERFKLSAEVSEAAARHLGYEYRPHPTGDEGKDISLVFGPDEKTVKKKKKKPFYVVGQIHNTQCLVSGLDKTETSVRSVLKLLRVLDPSWSDVETKTYHRRDDPENKGFIVYFCQRKEEPVANYHVEFMIPEKASKKANRQPTLKLIFSKCNFS